MSAKGQAFVEAHSPYTGNIYLIHLRFGMLENETYMHRLFMGDVKVAELCRCSIKTVQRARERMVADGFLEVIKPATKGHMAEYEFLYPESLGGHSDALGGHSDPVGWTSTETSPIYRKKDKLKESNSSTASDGPAPTSRIESSFEDAWAVYPRKEVKKASLKMFTARVKAGIKPSDLVTASANYARVRQGWERDKIMLGSTFFGPNDRYVDFLPGGAGLESRVVPRSRAELDLEIDEAVAFVESLFESSTEVERPLDNALADKLLDLFSRRQLGAMKIREVRNVIAAMVFERKETS